MNTIVANVLMSQAAKAKTDVRPFTMVAVLCGVGLLASVCLVSWGFDLGAEFF